MFRNSTPTQITSQACRRSVRLHNKNYHNHMSWFVEFDPLGLFALLPNELMYHILNTLRIQDLGFLSLTSKAFRDVVLEYARSKSGLKRLQPRQIAPSRKTACNKQAICNNQVNHYKNMGLLLKRTTCLFPTRERLKTVEFFISQLQCVNRLYTCQALSCYGNLLSTFTRGWEERECLRAYITISENQSITGKILIMLSGSPGSNPAVEIRTRRFLRHVLLDQCKTMEDLSMWLHFILKPFPMVHQARLLYLLYGPLCPGKDAVFWDCMRETSIGDRETRSRTIAPLGEIAMALKGLVNHIEWSDDDVISVLEELTGCPDEWLIENIARLLILCGEPMALKLLGSKAINGKMNELGSIIVAFSVVLYDEGLHMSWLIEVMQQLCRMMKTAQDVKSFLASLTATYKDFIVALMNSPGDEVTRMQFQLHHVAMAQADFMQTMMQQLFNGKALS